MLAQEGDGARPGVLRRLQVGAAAAILLAEEAVARSLVDVRLVDFDAPLPPDIQAAFEGRG